MLPEPPKRTRQPVDGSRKLRAPPNSVAERHNAESEAYSAESARPLPTSIKKSGVAGVAPPPVKAPAKPEKLRPQVQRIPELAWLMGDIDVEKPEKELLFLPSEYPSSMRGELKLHNADAGANGVRPTYRSCVRAASRFADVYSDPQHQMWKPKSAYRKSYAALLKPGLSADNQALKPLLRQHLRGKDGKAQAAGQVKDSDPWFWRTGRPSGLSESEEEEWNTELDRVKWFRLRALLGRSTEERETLDEEFSCAVLWFHKTANIWRCLAAESEMPGRVAYAEKQADMYTELASRCFIARGTLSRILAADLKKQEAKESKEAARAKKVAATAEEDEWDTLG
ncbi:hypothetical protein DFH09DRAFT_1284231 [Mycena vulgaris]|nr:hypothetical protein DFH09DRAFT_1284231 [Mycena vulgaris]